MNAIVQIHQGQPTTTSLAIAEGVGNQHKAVIQLIRQNADDLQEFGLLTFEMRPRPEGQHGGSDVEYAILNEQQAALLLTYFRNNDVVKQFKKALIKAFFEMRDQLNKRETPSYHDMPRIEILKMAMQAEEERLKLAHENQDLITKIAADAPKVAFAKQVEAAPDAISIAKAAKILGTGQRRLFSLLREIAWVSRRNEPYQDKIESRLMDVKLGSWEHPDHGLQQSVTPLITGKGLTKLQAIVESRKQEPLL
jgi:anti-repressor protein